MASLNEGARRSNGEAAAFEAPDPRAEGARRLVRLGAGHVTIARRLAGMRMKIVLPLKAYRGVALSLRSDSRRSGFALTLSHADPDLSVPLVESPGDEDIIAEWSGWAQRLGLPRLIETDAGGVLRFDEALGAVRLGRGCEPRRRGRLTAKRRPRFLARRKRGPKL